jgi:hypothetical protein
MMRDSGTPPVDSGTTGDGGGGDAAPQDGATGG